MKKQMLLVAVLAALSVQAGIAAPEKAADTPLKPLPGQTMAARFTSVVLGKAHYKPLPLDDAMSEKIFDRYFKSLDAEKMFFTQADIDQYSIVRTRLDDAINTENLSVPFAIFNLYQQRFNERIAYARELVKQGKFEFASDESYQYDREKVDWAKSDAEVKDLWRKRVKNEWLRLKLAGKDDKSIRETLDKRYEGYLSPSRKLTSEDVFQIFMNAYAMSIEPHTNYLGPRAADNFDIAMRLSLEGIGCVLQSRDDYTVVREVVTGSPAGLSGKVKVGDKIVGVAKDEKTPMTEVMGWRLDDVVALIRGPKDSTVKLEIIPADAGPDGKHTFVTLVRQKISMEEQSAKKSIYEVKDGNAKRRVGVISLPTFYMDFEARRKGDKDFKSATRDVKRLLVELKKDKVDNVLIDLRNNGGGSLSEAVELTGLFIDKGPVVMQRTGDNKVEVESDTDPGMAWDGPMGVLINRGSASASEIFAAAIQDYGRGIIIGEPSFGKGTVQTLFDLNRFAPGEKTRYGELKYTVAQFFRINGGTTQLRGVTPDIKLPTMGDSDQYGESSYENALPWTQIKPAVYIPAGEIKDILPLLDKRHDARVSKDKDFQYLLEDIALVKKQRKENSVSLNEVVRRKERDQQESRSKLREARLLSPVPGADDPILLPDPKEALNKAISASAKPAGKAAQKVAGVKGALRSDDGLQGSERSLAAELEAEKQAKAAKDVLLNEAVHIMGDEVGLLKTDTRLAARVLPYAADGK
ncbi:MULTISPECIES: carboxy terminal-processing peptidase [unclassified Duganella]|uniref:carboxy terminal-processing peptidase n=1 Tax=unclassified Duganella TaxID=2636909 RepID=UPI00088CA25E|nr:MULTISPECIES: carboxy terminal-processing peptidase [unclassified Duganella]SDF65698.1 carboxyl-terminal processing protease [Duganella sp. OV458]SDI63149.1 carboxyl-terminal processing protease [Duganella sp. OV510]